VKHRFSLLYNSGFKRKRSFSFASSSTQVFFFVFIRKFTDKIISMYYTPPIRFGHLLLVISFSSVLSLSCALIKSVLHTRL
jgi:hypothetical protein